MLDSKISDFVTHLLANPSIKNEPPLIAEGFLLNFIDQNADKLKSTFKSPQFFPDMNPQEVISLLIEDLRDRTSKKILPRILDVINELDFSVLHNYMRSSLDNNFLRNKFAEFVKTLFRDKEARLNFNPIINMFTHDALSRYVGYSFFKRSPLYFELVRVQKNNIPVEHYIPYLVILMLIRNAAYVKEPVAGFSESRVSIIDFMKIPKSLNDFIAKKALALQPSLPGVSAEVIKMALKSNVPSTMVNHEDSSAKFLFLLCARFHNYNEYKTIDKGAESPDKSWFGAARKNAAFYGYDKRILEDLYIIAGDNNW